MFWETYIQRRGDTSLESRAMQTMLLLLETSLEKKTRTFGTMKLEAMFHYVQKVNLIFFSGRTVFESAALILPSAILDSVHSAHGSRMDGMAFYPFRKRNAE